MPFLAVELDAVNLAPDLGRAGGLTEEAAGFGLIRMWAWCFRAGLDQVSAAQLAGFFGGDPARVGPALVAFGFLELRDGGWRVRGADRYLRLQEARRRGGLASRKNLRRGDAKSPAEAPGAAEVQPGSTSGSVPALTPSTEHRAPSTEKKKLAGTAPADPRSTEGAGPGDDVDPAYRALVQALFTAFQELRGEPYLPAGKDWKALAGLRKTQGAEEIGRRWRIGLSARFGARCSTFWDLGQRWNACAQPEVAQGLQAASRVPNGAATAADKDWT